jgi:hypothetical protein
MNMGLFAMLAGFLLPLALCIRLSGMLAVERARGWAHPLNLVLATQLTLASVPVVALTPSAWLIVSGKSIEAGALLLDFTATGWGFAKLGVNIVGVLLADAALPRVCDQLTREPASTERPTRHYLLRDLGVLATCLLLACAAAFHR